MQTGNTPEADSKPPAASGVIAYFFCTFGLFYGFIAAVDPYL